MQPLVLGITYASCALSSAALCVAFTRIPLVAWLACTGATLALQLSNLHYRRTHAVTTVGMMPVALFALAPACTVCLCVPGMPKAVRMALGLVLVCLVALILLFAFWFCRLRSVYSTRPDVSPTAAIIVLGGALRQGKPCRTLARRLDVALRYWQECPSRTLLPSGGPVPDGTTTEARAMARYLQDRGVPSTSLVLEAHARNTRENIERSCELLSEMGHVGQRCVVSSDYHLWRALREARRQGVELTPIPAPTPRGSALQQWCREVITILLRS